MNFQTQIALATMFLLTASLALNVIKLWQDRVNAKASVEARLEQKEKRNGSNS